jgi:hypothetical protein
MSSIGRDAAQCAVGLPMWSSKLLFAVHGGVPIVKEDISRLDGDLLLGYNGERFGISGFGSLYNYEISDDRGRSETFRTEGSLEAWLGIPLGERTKLDVRAGGGSALYSTDVFPKAGGFFEETQLMGRGQLQAGIRTSPTDTTAIALHLGGGLQIENYDATTVAKRSVLSSSRTPTTARGMGRFRAQWNAWPDVISLRLAADASYLRITTSSTTQNLVSNAPAQFSESESSQVEFFPRGYVDLDLLRVLEFRPALTVGANIVSVDGATGTTPVFGLGIRRESF